MQINWWSTLKELNFLYTLIRRALKTVEDKVDKCAAQPALEGGLPLEFPVVTPRVVGPGTKPSISLSCLKVMKTYKMNLQMVLRHYALLRGPQETSHPRHGTHQ